MKKIIIEITDIPAYLEEEITLFTPKDMPKEQINSLFDFIRANIDKIGKIEKECQVQPM